MSLKHSTLKFTAPAATNINVTFIWAPFVKNVSSVLLESVSGPKYDLFVAGAANWDALYGRDLKSYSSDLNALADAAMRAGAGITGGLVSVWMQPTTIIDGRLTTEAKQQFMTEKVSSWWMTFDCTKRFVGDLC